MKTPLSRNANPASLPPGLRRGAALVIVLAFMVLLAGLIVAFFSRAMSERAVSDSSANNTRADIFAQGAINSIIGQIEQEIAAGSGTSGVMIDGTTYTIYTPVNPADATPAIAVNSKGGDPYTYAPNLLKESAYGVPFYSGTNYPNGPAASANATAITADNYSLNGFRLRKFKWNDPDLMPAASTYNTAGTPFQVPSWIVVQRNGGNPTQLNAAMVTSATNGSAVIGRYAYAMYNEGGLLDVNVAGFPNSGNISTPPPSALETYKNAQAYADLTTIGLTQGEVNQLVAWRNYVETNPQGSFPNYSGLNTGSYCQFVNWNPYGFMSLGSMPGPVVGKTDRAFSTRHQLIDFFNTLASQPGNYNQSAMDGTILTYLTHFSRGLNQPSFTPDPNRPLVLPETQGGNDQYGNDTPDNPAFLSIRVPASGVLVRNDGSLGQPGEPLVKKRFALNRLAWITYLGPSATRNVTNPSASGSDADIYALENTYGVPVSFLQQGTGGSNGNIRKYFGLVWSGSNWNYSSEASGSGIQTLQTVANAGKEPNFFELLKAAIDVGSLAKVDTDNGSDGDTPAVPGQYATDVSVDNAIMQIGANIIDQATTDNFPTGISFTATTGSSNTVYGVKNLPYINRVRTAMLPLVSGSMVIVTQSGSHTYGPQGPNGAGITYIDGKTILSGSVTNTGVMANIEFPEIWNPNDWNTSTTPYLNQTLGVVGPQQFRIYAQGTTTWPVGHITLDGSFNGNNSGNYSPSSQADPSTSPGYSSMYGFLFGSGFWGGVNPGMSMQSTLMTFNIPATAAGAALFREPTLLYMPNQPAACALSATGMNVSNSALGAIATSRDASFFAPGGGLYAVETGTYNLPKAGQAYVGFYVGAIPRCWHNAEYNCILGTDEMQYLPAYNTFTGTYYLQCSNGNGGWITYDTKTAGVYSEQIGGSLYDPGVGFASGSSVGVADFRAIDPRTSRWGFIPNNNISAPIALNLADGTQQTERPAGSAGYNFQIYKDAGGSSKFPPPAGWLSSASGYGWYMNTNVFGLFSQNLVSGSNYYQDPDGVVRRASGGLASTATLAGLPMATANTDSAPTNPALVRTAQSNSRPMVLNRPFQSVAELGYVFSGTPWKNIDFFTPESGNAALLDVFCINDSSDSQEMVSGKVDLNTRQAPVLQAILSGAYADEQTVHSTSQPASSALLSGTLSSAIANALVTRTIPTSSGGKGLPLRNISELVGRLAKPLTGVQPPYNGATCYDGFSADLAPIFSNATNLPNIQRYYESTVRALANTGQTRVWNLMFDVLAQTGVYPASRASYLGPDSAKGLDGDFMVEGERRYWVHVAIDRYTGAVLDEQIEPANEN
ncbi:MAG TPA: hypothetical protein VHY22_08430 [Chthoniobacteraceae bacterium]|jgi:Tfp pilus assembly protein PilX|nr:hypothetical protein [Chthoniobacteraceae bacterium]